MQPSLTERLGDRFIIERPWLALAVMGLLCAFFAAFLPRFQLDASADSLLLENDSELTYYSGIVARYGSESFLVVTYTATDDLYADATLADLRALRDELLAMERVQEVISILDVPLINSPRQTIASLQEHVPTLEDPTTDRELARREFRESPVYSDFLVSPDGLTTGMLIRFARDADFDRLQGERNALREKLLDSELTVAEQRRLDELSNQVRKLRRTLLAQEQADVRAVRAIVARHQQNAAIQLGGMPLIVSDMIDYIRNDIAVFGVAIAVLLVVLLVLIFGRFRWVVVSLLCCIAAVVVMSGLLGLLRWPVTVVSSNFVALLLIFSLSLTVHLIQRYRELHQENPTAEQAWLVRTTLRDKARPCLFTAITTVVGFASLLVSGIRPVIDFGWMMVIGMCVVVATAFVLFPACLMLLQPGPPHQFGGAARVITGQFASFAAERSRPTVWACLGLLVLSLVGMSLLQVENRFIDYFKPDTDIYKGMVTIDRELGGTAPLEVILDAEPEFLAAPSGNADTDDEFADADFDADFDDDFDDELGDEFAADATGSGAGADLGATSYWYNTYRLGEVREVHRYIESLPETGKVLSMATTIDMLEILNQDETPGTFFLSILYNRLPQNIKSALFDPYMSADGNQVRLSVRVFETDPNLRRDELINRIRSHLVDELGYAPERVHVTGMLVLYNNVLQSLYRSQILTLGVVLLSIMIMFAVLFRSLRVAAAAILPSVLSVGVVLGVMGLLGIPLDIMTITIAAISVGIGVDDSIHYVHRYRHEIMADDDPFGAMRRSHASVGAAMFYTSVIVTVGFSVLGLSNFIPSILFGLLTGLVMLMALAANLTLLPILLRWWNIR